jgi:hypothetical protein
LFELTVLHNPTAASVAGRQALAYLDPEKQRQRREQDAIKKSVHNLTAAQAKDMTSVTAKSAIAMVKAEKAARAAMAVPDLPVVNIDPARIAPQQKKVAEHLAILKGPYVEAVDLQSTMKTMLR